MARWQGTTTERGYGWEHQAERARRVAAYRPGDPCAMCGRPMRCHPRYLDLPHDHRRGGYLPGLAHRSCNRADGARRKNAGWRRNQPGAHPGPAAPAYAPGSRDW